jgi:cytochrome c biogenesis factor
MRYFLKYYIWTIILLATSFCYVLFGPITRIAKQIDNIFLLIFPIIVTALMIRNYPFDKALRYFKKFGIMTIYFLFILILLFSLGQWNPAGMQMNEEEKNLGHLGIILIYGTLLFILGAITIIFIRPKNNNK